MTVLGSDPARCKWVPVSVCPWRQLSYSHSGQESNTGNHDTWKPTKPYPALQTPPPRRQGTRSTLSRSQKLAKGSLSLAESVKCHHCWSMQFTPLLPDMDLVAWEGPSGEGGSIPHLCAL